MNLEKKQKKLIILSLAFLLLVTLVPNLIQKIGLPSLSLATWDKETGLPIVNNLIKNGDFGEEKISSFGRIIQKVIPVLPKVISPDPDKTPPGWEFYRANPQSPLPKTETITEKPYTYVKETALYLNTKGKNTGLSQKLPLKAKPPLFVQANVLVVSGGVRLALVDKNGKEIISDEIKAEKNLASLSFKEIRDSWEKLAFNFKDKQTKAKGIRIYSLTPNSKWYLTNLVVTQPQDYSSFGKKLEEYKKGFGGEIPEDKLELYYYGEKVEPPSISPEVKQDNSSSGEENDQVLGVKETTMKVTFIGFTSEYDLVRNDIITFIDETWDNHPINKIIETDIEKYTNVEGFDPKHQSSCSLENKTNGEKFFVPKEFCGRVGRNEIKIIFAMLGEFGYGGPRVLISVSKNSSESYSWQFLKHELGHSLGAPDVDFVDISGKGNALFPNGNFKYKTEFNDVMYSMSNLLCSRYTAGLINRLNNTSDLWNWQPQSLYLVKKENNNNPLNGTYKIYAGENIAKGHHVGKIKNEPYAQGSLVSGVIRLDDNVNGSGYELKPPFVIDWNTALVPLAGFIVVNDGEVEYRGQFDLIDVTMSYWDGKESHVVVMKENPLPPRKTPPQFGACNSCNEDIWGGCTPPEQCKLINDQSICARNNKGGAPCCLRDMTCSPDFKYNCGEGLPDVFCDKCQHFDPPDSPLCSTWQLDCHNGRPAPARLKAPDNGISFYRSKDSLSGSAAMPEPITLAWYTYGEGLFAKCGETLPGGGPDGKKWENWHKWDDCNGEWRFGSPAACITETGNNDKAAGIQAGDRSCWGYMCAKGSFGIPQNWRFYNVFLKEPGADDFQQICHLENIPNPPPFPRERTGGSIDSSKTSCDFNPKKNGEHQWYVQSGYQTNIVTGEGDHLFTNTTNSQTATFNITSVPVPPITRPITPKPRVTGPIKKTTPTPTPPYQVRKEPTPTPKTEAVVTTPDQFPLIQEPLSISLGGTRLGNGAILRSHPIPLSLQAHLEASDDQKIEEILLHLKKEGEDKWRELGKMDCQSQGCLVNQSISLPANLPPGNYLLAASVWDHLRPTSGQHFGTTGAQFKDSACSATSSYCHSPLLRFNFKVESITCSQFKERDNKSRYAPGEELNFNIEIKTNNNIPLETVYVKIGEKGAQAPTLSFESSECKDKTSCSLTIPAPIAKDSTTQSLIGKDLQAWIVAKTITSQAAEPVSCSDIENRTGPSQDYPICGCPRINLTSN